MFVLLIFSCYITNIFSWTIDLPEVRQYYFSKYGNNFEKKNVALKDGEYLYNNYFSNTPHHEHNPGYKGPDPTHGHNQGIIGPGEDHEYKSYIGPVDRLNNIYGSDDVNGKNYAVDYEYQSYMEKKVHKIVLSGSKYLEGLRRAIEQYQRRLENCTNTNFTTLMSEGSYVSCARATKKSEHVRRLSQLAIYTTRQIEERARNNKYKEESLEDRALLLRLAFFLDKLTELTGFEPDPSEHLTTTPDPPVSTPRSVVADLMQQLNFTVSDDAKLFFINCLNNNSSENAVTRCNFPGFELPPQIRRFLNISGNASAENTENSPNSNPEAVAGLPIVRPDSSPASTDQKQASSSAQDLDFDLDTSESINTSPKARPKPIQKRSIPDDPIQTFVINYAKNKAWLNVNPDTNKAAMKQEFHDENGLLVKAIEKRSAHQSEYHVPEDPMQDISSYIKHRAESYLHPDKQQAERLRQYLEDIHKSKQNKVNTRSKRKRSIYQRARIPEDPEQDISYYVKNKEGTEIIRNPVQAALVRLGLEQIFQTGNIEVIRRYGSNYNPLVPDHVSAGLLRSGLDT